VEKAFVAQRVANKLFATENAVDSAMAEATEMMAELLRARKDLGLSATVGDSVVSKVVEAISALSEARTAMVSAHGELAELKLRVGIRTKLSGVEDKVEQAPETTTLRQVS
jgi:hypothetical protein